MINLAQGSSIQTEMEKFFQDKWKLSRTDKKYLLKNKVLADANVDTHKNIQSFKLKTRGLHTKRCERVLKKLSRFEDYADWIDFIKSSTYSEKNNLLTMKADHTLLPFPMIVHIIMQRPTGPGEYPFTFPTGIFKGLKGRLYVKNLHGRCLFYSVANWQGKDTGISDLVIELFSETLAIKGGETLFRKTLF